MKRAGVIIIGLFLLAGCSKPKAQYGEIYKSDNGTNEAFYARSYQDGGFWYWIYNSIGSGGSSDFSTRNSFSSGTWTRVPATAVPADLKPTDKVVEEKEGEPTEDVAEKSTVPGDDIVTETTTPGQESEMESSDSESTSESSSDEKSSSSESESSSSSSSEESSSSDESSSDSGGDSDDDN